MCIHEKSKLQVQENIKYRIAAINISNILQWINDVKVWKESLVLDKMATSWSIDLPRITINNRVKVRLNSTRLHLELLVWTFNPIYWHQGRELRSFGISENSSKPSGLSKLTNLFQNTNASDNQIEVKASLHHFYQFWIFAVLKLYALTIFWHICKTTAWYIFTGRCKNPLRKYCKRHTWCISLSHESSKES